MMPVVVTFSSAFGCLKKIFHADSGVIMCSFLLIFQNSVFVLREEEKSFV